ncbi:MAG: GNAT family N-acetyltransferase [Deltaproteobacteria bacterium]|nr:GNAT family N-acetyltransferase [Deltaproteobacteria bacterium]
MPTTDEQPVVRALVEADVPAVIALYRRAMVPVWDACGRDYDLDRIEANLRSRLGDDEYVVEGVDGDEGLLSYVAWEQHRDHTSHHAVAHLRMLLVDPRAQRTGLATRLVHRFEDAARAAGCTKVLFDVIVGSPANTFYQRLGFRHWSNYMEKIL